MATIDADTVLMPYALRRAVARLLASPPDTVAVAGAVFVRNSRSTLLARLQEWDYFLGIAAVKRQQALLQGTAVAQGSFSVYDTSALHRVNGWPNRIAIAGVMLLRQRRALRTVGARPRRNILGFAGYLLFYPFLVAPIAFTGYVLELAAVGACGSAPLEPTGLSQPTPTAYPTWGIFRRFRSPN